MIIKEENNKMFKNSKSYYEIQKNIKILKNYDQKVKFSKV